MLHKFTGNINFSPDESLSVQAYRRAGGLVLEPAGFSQTNHIEEIHAQSLFTC